MTSCDEVAALFEGHAAGTLSAPDAVALRTHALSCDRCASALRGLADLEPPPAETTWRRTAAQQPRTWRARHPVILAVVALTLMASSAATVWHTVGRPRVPRRVLRGRGGDLALIAACQPDGTVRLSWSPTPGAQAYRVEVSGTTGAELSQSVTQPLLALQDSDVASLGDLAITVDSETASGERATRSTRLRAAPCSESR